MTGIVFDAFVLPAGYEVAEYEEIDIGRGSSVTYRIPSLDSDAARTLTRRLSASGDLLAAMSATDIAQGLGRVGARFLDVGDDLRREALDLLPATASLSRQMAAAVLDGMAADWTRPRFLTLLESEFGPDATIGQLQEEDPRLRTDRGGRASAPIPPGLCVQIVSGSVPGVGVSAMVRSLLVGGPTLVKPGLGDVVLPVLFARALHEEDGRLADAVAVTYWPGGSVEPEDTVIGAADVIVVYGADETVHSVRTRAPVTSRVVAYHNRVSVAVVGRDALLTTPPDPTAEDDVGPDAGPTASASARAVAAELAEAVAMFDQRGCVCPQTVFVEEGGLAPEHFAGLLAGALAEVEERWPSSGLEVEEAAALHQWRGSAEMLEATGWGHIHHGGAGASWTVVYEPEPKWGAAPGGRCIRVRPVADVDTVADLLEPIGPHLQTVGYAGLSGRAEALAPRWGRAGASRVVPLRDMAFPPPWWLHDGRRPLRDLVRWVEFERG